ncbi:putative transporter [bacterium MnTg02]|nr:putative transporter [bacterium MnTg02]
MTFGIEHFHMWATFALICLAIIVFAVDKIPLELSTAGIVATLLVFFHLFPFPDPITGQNALDVTNLLKGFANPVLFAILALLIIGQGLFHTGAVERPAQLIGNLGRFGTVFAFSITFLVAGAVSAFLNNTPVVIIFVPIVSAIATRLHVSSSAVLMPLSFITILGGMTTLIGSSANLIAASLAEESGMAKIGFFDFAVPGALLFAIGSLYVLFVLPRLLPPRANMAEDFTKESGRQFIAQITVTDNHPWLGTAAKAGFFPALTDMTVRLVQRANQAILPPFEDITLKTGDIVIVAATRKVLAEAVKSGHSVQPIESRQTYSDGDQQPLLSDSAQRQQLTMVEAVVAPGSRLIGRTLEQSGWRSETGSMVLGVQRHSRMVRTPPNQIRLEAGDVLLLLSTRETIRRLRTNRDFLIVEWSATELPVTHHANRALVIFAATIALAASGVLPIAVATFGGAAAMVMTGCLNIRQASRAIDTRIYFLIGTAFALAEPLRATGGAEFIAHVVVQTFSSYGPAVTLSAFFLLTAILTNFLSNHATAALLAPVAVSTAAQMGVDPAPFVFGLIFALNCSFATPIAYQTNLIVMGPGHYRFSDFLLGGVPLILLIWLSYSIFAPIYYGF